MEGGPRQEGKNIKGQKLKSVLVCHLSRDNLRDFMFQVEGRGVRSPDGVPARPVVRYMRARNIVRRLGRVDERKRWGREAERQGRN